MKKWYSITCPTCGWRHPPKKFNKTLKPIAYPVSIVTGGGRAKGFRVADYLPWSTLPALRPTNVWTNILCLYVRLAAAYDKFYEVLGFLSPKITKLLQLQKPYEDAYRPSPFAEYGRIYGARAYSRDIVDAYPSDDYTDAYRLLGNSVLGGEWGE